MRKTLFERLQKLYLRIFDTDIIRRIVRNSSYLVSSSVIVAGIGFVQGILQYRALDDLQLIGLLLAISGFTNLINRLTSFRIDEMVVRYVRLYQERKQPDKAAAVFKMAALLESFGSLLAFLIIWLAAPLGVKLFSDISGTEGWFILYGSLVLVNIIFDSSDGMLQVFDRFDAKAIIDVGQSLVRLAATVFVLLTGGGLFEIILAELAGRLVRSVGVIGLALHTASKTWGRTWWRMPLNTLQDERRSLLTFAFSTNLSATVSLVAKDSEDLWASHFLGNAFAGVYGIARTLIGLLQIPVSPLPATTYPELSRAVAQDDWQTVRSVLRRGSQLAAFYSLPVAVLLVFFGRSLINLYNTSPDALQAYSPLLILAASYTFTNILYWNRAALLAFNRPVFPTLVNFTGMLLKVGAILIFGSSLGASGFATLLAAYYIFTVGIAALRVRQDLRRHLGRAQAPA